MGQTIQFLKVPSSEWLWWIPCGTEVVEGEEAAVTILCRTKLPLMDCVILFLEVRVAFTVALMTSHPIGPDRTMHTHLVSTVLLGLWFANYSWWCSLVKA